MKVGTFHIRNHKKLKEIKEMGTRLRLKILFSIIFLSFIGYVSHLNATVAIKCGVNSPRIPLTAELMYTTTVIWDIDSNLYDFTWPDPPQSAFFEVTGNATSSGRTVENGGIKASKTFSYTLTPLKTGTATIEPATVTFTTPKGAGGTLRTTTVMVTIVPGKTGSAWRYVFVLITVLLLGSIGFILFKFVQKRKINDIKETTGIDNEVPTSLTPVGQAQHDIALLEHYIIEGEPKSYCTEILKIARLYIEQRYYITLGNQLTDQILHQVREHQVPEPVIAPLQRILETGDALKYATSDPTKEQLERLKKYTLDLLKTD